MSDLNLKSFTSAFEWAKANVPDAGVDDDGPAGERMEERILAYMTRYEKVMRENSVVVHRAIMIKKIEDLILDEIGIHWSFEIDGAGVYGLNRDPKAGEKVFVVTASIPPSDIDWEYGFTSFLYYGEDQWECAVVKGTTIRITSVDGKILEESMNGRA